MQMATDIEMVEKAVAQFLERELPLYLERYVSEREIKLKELALIERIVRVEEELKNLRLFEAQRHEKLYSEMNTRFEALQREMDLRFEALQKEMNTRFEALQKEMNTRFEAFQKEMNTRFEALQKEMDTRFEAMHTRFEAMNARFEALQKEIHVRFEALEKRFSFNQWLTVAGFSFIALLISVLSFFPKK